MHQDNTKVVADVLEEGGKTRAVECQSMQLDYSVTANMYLVKMTLRVGPSSRTEKLGKFPRSDRLQAISAIQSVEHRRLIERNVNQVFQALSQSQESYSGSDAKQDLQRFESLLHETGGNRASHDATSKMEFQVHILQHLEALPTDDITVEEAEKNMKRWLSYTFLEDFKTQQSQVIRNFVWFEEYRAYRVLRSVLHEGAEADYANEAAIDGRVRKVVNKWEGEDEELPESELLVRRFLQRYPEKQLRAIRSLYQLAKITGKLILHHPRIVNSIREWSSHGSDWATVLHNVKLLLKKQASNRALSVVPYAPIFDFGDLATRRKRKRVSGDSKPIASSSNLPRKS